MDAFAHYEVKEVDEDDLPDMTLEEVAQHNTADDLWIVVYGKVYDVTEWQHEHPGGDEILQANAGKDVSTLFKNVGHSPDANAIRTYFIIGKLVKKIKKAKL